MRPRHSTESVAGTWLRVDTKREMTAFESSVDMVTDAQLLEDATRSDDPCRGATRGAGPEVAL